MHRATQPEPPAPNRSRRLAILLTVTALLLAGTAVTVVHFVLSGGSGGRPASLAADHSRPGTAGPSARSSQTPSPSVTSPSKSAAASSHPPAAAPGSAQQCTNPQFVTSDPNGGWTDGRYYVTNNMWNATGYSVQQSLHACSFRNWYVVATMSNGSGDGAVKTYPNVHEDFSEPPISSFHSITSTFAEASPRTGIYEDAYDIWINGVASSGSTEVMIWNDNHGQVPSGSNVANASFGGRSYRVWQSGHYIAFVAATNFTSGTMDLLAFFRWIINAGWMPASSTLGQIDYGAELVSTNGTPATFSFTNFSITAG